MPRYPIGTPQPGDLDTPELLIQRELTDIDRKRGLHPPPDKALDTWLIPEAFWRQIQANEIRNVGQRLGIREQGQTLAHNVRVQSAGEAFLAPFYRKQPRVVEQTVAAIYEQERQRLDERVTRAIRTIELLEAEQPGFAQRAFETGGNTFRPSFVETLAERGPEMLRDIQVQGITQELPPGAAGLLTDVRGRRELEERTRQFNYQHGASWLNDLGSMFGKAFDGRRFVTSFGAQLNATLETGGGVWGDRDERATYWYRELNGAYEELPMPMQRFIDELNPGNIGIALAGGPLARMLAASGVRGAGVLANAIRPFSAGPTGPLREVAASAGARIGYEYTDGAPLPIRLAAGLLGIYAGAQPGAILSPVVRAARQGVREAVAAPGSAIATRAIRAATGPVESFQPRGSLLDTRPPLIRGAADDLFPPVLPVTRSQQLPDRAVLRAAAGRGAIEPLPAGETRPWYQVQDPRVRAAQLEAQLEIRGGAAINEPAWARRVPRGAWEHIVNAIQDVPTAGSRIARFLNRSTDFLHIRQAYFAEGAAQAEVLTRTRPSLLNFFDRIESLMGGVDSPFRVRYIGPDQRQLAFVTPDGHTVAGRTVQAADHPLHGTVIDGMENPEYYDLIPEQRAVLEAFSRRNTEVSRWLDRDFGVASNIFEGTQELGGRRAWLHVPSVDRSNRFAATDFSTRAAAIQGRLEERGYNSISARLESVLEGGFKPETNVRVLFTALDEAKAFAAGRNTFRWGVGGSLEHVPGTQLVEKLGIVVGDQRLNMYLPDEEVKAVARLLDDSRNWFFDLLDNWRMLRLNGDTSPMTIQGSLGAFVSPYDTAGSIADTVRRGELLKIGSAKLLMDNVAADPEGWLAFARHTGMPITRGTPDEFAVPDLLRRVPVLGGALGRLNQVNEGMFTIVMRGMKRDFDEFSALLVREGADLEAARAAAGDQVTKIVPLFNPRRAGLSRGRARVERAAVTSISFIRQPASFMREATTGYLKLGLHAVPDGVSLPLARWATLTPQERLAAQMFAKGAGTVMAMSIASQLLYARDRNLTLEEAIGRALDVDGPDFARVFITPEISIPIGGPYRALFKALWPKGPASMGDGLWSFGRGRFSPGVGTAADLASGEDYFGESVRSGNFWSQLADSIIYAAEQVPPIALTTPFEARRRGLSPEQARIEAVGGFFGQSPSVESPFQQIERTRRGGAIDLLRGGEEAMAALGMTPAQQVALDGARTLDDMRDRIGTNAANFYAEASSGDFEGSFDRYVEDLRRRAERGDRVAEALLVSVETQERLAALALDDQSSRPVVLPNGEIDRGAYRERRAGIIHEQIGRSEAYRDVFEGFRSSSNEIDQLTAQWFDLFEKATVVVDGKPLEVDFQRFNEMEEQFFAALDPQTAALVEANIGVAPRGANEIEVELRQVRRDLDAAGFWDVDDQVWLAQRTNAVTVMQSRGLFRDDQRSAAEIAATFDTRQEFHQFVTGFVTSELRTNGWQNAPALARAKKYVDSLDVFRALGERVTEARQQWAAERLSSTDQADRDLVRRAMEWEYLDIYQLDDPSIFDAPADNPSEGEDAEPPPESRALTETERMAALFEAGSSYGQIAIKFNMERGAVISRLRRHFGGSPLAARESA